MTTNPTRTMLARMLKENTGRHMLDSGDAYGRHWQRNQGRNFAAEPPARLCFEVYANFADDEHWHIQVDRSLYHWLAETLTYDKAMTARFYNWVKKNDDNDDSWFALCDRFLEEGLHRPYEVVNTYNHSNVLDQDYEYRAFDWPDDEESHYILLMIHGGADIRGGYTQPRAFQVDGDAFPNFHDINRFTVWCSNCKSAWDYEEPGWTSGDNFRPVADELPLQDYPWRKGETGEPGTFIITEAGDAFCPVCGIGKLEAY